MEAWKILYHLLEYLAGVILSAVKLHAHLHASKCEKIHVPRKGYLPVALKLFDPK